MGKKKLGRRKKHRKRKGRQCIELVGFVKRTRPKHRGGKKIRPLDPPRGGRGRSIGKGEDTTRGKKRGNSYIVSGKNGKELDLRNRGIHQTENKRRGVFRPSRDSEKKKCATICGGDKNILGGRKNLKKTIEMGRKSGENEST